MRPICLAGLIAAILFVGCSRPTPTPRNVQPVDEKKDRDKDPIRPVVDDPKKQPERPPLSGATGDEVVASLPGPKNDRERYEAALLEAVDFLADRKYPEALTALEKAQKYQDTGAVQREIDKVRTILAQQEAAEKAVRDVQTVLDDGKAEDAARLAGAALGQHGGGDRGGELQRLKQQADAVVSAAADDGANRRARLRREGLAALEEGNLRAAAVALEQALALGAEDELSRQLGRVRERLEQYDENRRRAAELRRDGANIDAALTRLEAAKKAWDTLQVRQEIEEFQLLLERRRDRVGVADFEVRGDVGAVAAGRLVAEELLPHFRPRFDIVERGQVNRLLDELRLEAGEVSQSPGAGRELARLARLRYLVVGSLTPVAGVTLHARLVEVRTGLVAQTARLSAPTVEVLLKKLRQVALVLQMNDEQKLAFEAQLQAAVEAVRPVEAAPVVALPTLPPPSAPPPPPIVTYTPRPPALGGVVIEDFRALPAVVVTPVAPPPPLALVIQKEDPRRHRLFRLSIELGDNLFRRGRYHEAQRHFSLALTLGGPRRELAVRLDNCQRLAPPPIVLPTPAVPVPTPVVVVPPPARPRMAVFGFVLNCRPGLVPPAISEVVADQFASYFGGQYELIDRGEVCWYMGRLNLTYRDVLTNAISRRCLAQALNARFFVFGTIQETASFNVATHLLDAETGARTGTGMIHVKDTEEMKLRLSELARQMGARAEERQQLVKQGQSTEATLNEARRLLHAGDSTRAREVAEKALKSAPTSVALEAVRAEAERQQKLAKFEADRRREAAEKAQVLAQARKRQEELARQAEEARRRAEAEAKARGEAARKQQEQQKQRAADQLRAQAKQATTRGEHARAVQLLQSAAALRASDDTFRELAQARAAALKAQEEQARAEQEKQARARKAQEESARQRIEKERAAQAKAAADRIKQQEAQTRTLHDGFLKQARDHLARKEYTAALAAVQSARRYQASAESGKLLQQAQDGIALADAEKKSAEERRKLEAERRQREEQQQRERNTYLAALKKGQDALAARRYAEAVSQYEAAVKLFPTDVAKGGLQAARDLQRREQEAALAAKRAGEEQAKKDRQVKDLLSQGQKALTARQHAKAIDLFRQVMRLAPNNVEALAGLSRAERERDAEAARVRREQEEKARQAALTRWLTEAKAHLAKKDNPAAVQAARQALALYPDHAEAKALLARALVDPKAKKLEEDFALYLDAARSALKNNNPTGALKALENALKLKPADRDALALRSDAERLVKAEKVKVTEAAYQNWLKQGQTALAGKKYAEALKGFDEALKVKPGDAVAIKGKKEAQEALNAEAARAKAAEEARKKEMAYQAWLKYGQTALAAKRWADAIKGFDEALKVKPGDAVAIKGKKEAEAALKAPPPVDPKKKAYEQAMATGREHVKARRYAEAVKAFDAALAAVPGDRAAKAEHADATKRLRDEQDLAAKKKTEAAYQNWLKQGQTALAGKKYAEALKGFDEALKVKPGDAVAIKGKKEAQEALNAEAARAKAAEEARKKEMAYQAWLKYGQTALAAKRWADAIKGFDEALKVKPGDAVAIKGKKEAEAALKAPPPVDPRAEFTKRMQQADSLEKQKKYADAVKVYQDALKWVPGDAKAQAQAYLGIGRSEHAARRFAEAVKAYEEVLKRNPADAEAKAALPRARANKP